MPLSHEAFYKYTGLPLISTNTKQMRKYISNKVTYTAFDVIRVKTILNRYGHISERELNYCLPTMDPVKVHKVFSELDL